MTLIAVIYGYAHVSKADNKSKNLDTQLGLLAEHCIRDDLVYSDVASGRKLQRSGWQELMARVQEGDTMVVAFLNMLSRNFEDSVRIQAQLSKCNIATRDRIALEGPLPTRWRSFQRESAAPRRLSS